MHSHTPDEKSSLLRPGLVAGSVVSPESLAFASTNEVAFFCDLVEFRADALVSSLDAVEQAMQDCPVPALLTVRDLSEGGKVSLSPEERGKIFTRLLPRATAVDIEIAHLAAFPEVISAAKKRGIPVVASFHDFHKTPEASRLLDLQSMALDAGADTVKFATTLTNSRDLAVLAGLQENSATPLATMGMGSLGRVSRLLLARLGSVLNYGYLDQPTVGGQWPAKRLRELIRELREE